MKNRNLMITGAAIAGLLSGSLAAWAEGTPNPGATATDKADKGTHSCKGKNACKGQGGCRSSDNGCKGKNSCKGKGGCASSHR